MADGTVDDLARSISTSAEVRWTRDSVRHTESTTDATAFVRTLVNDGGEVEDLEVRRASLEDTYMAMVRRDEAHGRMSSRALHGVRIGLERGWIMFRHIITTADGIVNTVIWAGIPLVILFFNRNDVVEGTDLSLAVVALPGFLGLMIAASAIGPAYYIAAEREDGTVLRAKAVPHGILGYVTGVLTQASLETFLGIALILIPGFILFPGLVVDDPLRWGVFVVVVVLGLLAVLPAGVVIGSVVRSPRVVGGLGFLIIGGMAVVSGILIPLQTLPQWAQIIGQALPAYWIGVGMRFVFLPDAAAAIEIGQVWRLWEMTAVLSLWALGGILVAPAVLRRMARRESGASVEAARQGALQRM